MAVVTGIPHSRPSLGISEVETLRDVISSGYVAPGELSRRLGGEIARRHGCRYGVALNSCTSALHLALLGLKVGVGDRVAVPGLVCPAVLNPIRYVGAEAVMIDVRSSDHQIDLDRLKEIHRTKPIKAAIIPHRYGHLADLAELSDSGVALIEDGAHSLGATREASPALQGSVGVYSFYATKMIATGCGGALITDDSGVADFADRVSDYYRPGGMHDGVQYNYRMPDLNAAVGLAQMERLAEFISMRRDLARRYLELLPADVAVVAPAVTAGSVWYRFVVRTTGEERRAAILKRSARDGCGIGTIDIVLDSAAPSFRQTLPVSAAEWDRCVSLPIYPGLGAADQERVAECVRGDA